jgi:miniconductance mechanosensitive channel
VIGVLVFDALLDIANDVYSESESSKQVPIKGFIQVVKVVVACVCLVFVVALVIERSPLYLLSGLGALTAVLLIVFKDPTSASSPAPALGSTRWWPSATGSRCPRTARTGT